MDAGSESRSMRERERERKRKGKRASEREAKGLRVGKCELVKGNALRAA